VTAKALSPMDQAGADLVRRKARSVIRQARKIVEQGAIDATDVNDDGELPVEWDARRRRVALDMRESKRNAPVYIDVLTRRLESHEKLEAAKAGGNVSLNVAVINVVRPPAYEEIDVEVNE
jgi:hypothetical protein